MYGEPAATLWHGPCADGLSPRVRGTRGRERTGAGPGRSIPACTGNPHHPRTRTGRSAVYPRVYGEPFFCRSYTLASSGLSPRVRGTRYRRTGFVVSMGSIPACTGNPPRSASLPSGHGVYPRVYGEPAPIERRNQTEYGLSPRVRGTLHIVNGLVPHIRSIPACTGNPLAGHHPRLCRVVYPRVYGEPSCRWQESLHY